MKVTQKNLTIDGKIWRDLLKDNKFVKKYVCLNKKSRIRETLNLSTDADHRTNIFFW